jgi:hypothetical protein
LSFLFFYVLCLFKEGINLVDNVLLDTISKMRASGVEDSEIKKMLLEMGYTSENVESALGVESKEAVQETKTEEQSKVSGNVEPDSNDVSDVNLAEVPDIELASEVKTDSESISRDIEPVLSGDIESKVEDLQAKINVLTNIMNKILENQREILIKLK